MVMDFSDQIVLYLLRNMYEEIDALKCHK